MADENNGSLYDVEIIIHVDKVNGLRSKKLYYERCDLHANPGMQITWVMLLVGLSIILFEVFPEKSVWSIPVRQADEHMIAVPGSGGFSFLLAQKQEKYKTLTKEQQRFWKRILIVDDNTDITISFKQAIEDSNNNIDVNKRIEVYTSILL